MGDDLVSGGKEEGGGESRREVSRTGIAAEEPEPRAVTTKDQPTKRIRHVVSKRPRASASLGKPSPKKAKKGSKAEALAWMPEVIPLGTEEQEEKEEEEEEEAVPTLRSRGLRSRGPAILAEGELAGESTIAEGLKGLKRQWKGLKLRFQEFQLGLKLLRLMRERQRCNNLGLLAC